MLIKNRHKSSENDQVELAARSTNLLAVCVCVGLAIIFLG